MVVAVVRKNIKAHPAKHIFHILRIVSGENLRQLHQRMVIKARLFKIKLQKRRCREHMHALYFSVIPSSAVKPPRAKITTADLRRKKPGFLHHNAAPSRAHRVIILHPSRLPAIHMRRKFNHPFLPVNLREDFRPRAAAGAAETVKCIQLLRVFRI